MSVRTRSRAMWLALVTVMCMAVSAASAHAASRRVCGTPKPGHAACLAELDTSVKPVTRRALAAATGLPNAAPVGKGYGPSALQSAYRLATAAQNDGGDATVAVVDAYNDPDAASDLAAYRAAWGLPACGSGCFQVLNQQGNTSPLPANSQTYSQNPNEAWAIEESLDVDMVSAICPNCRIDLVEANSDELSDLGTAVNAAVNAGAQYVSNSYGADESSGDLAMDSEYYSHPSDVITASTGDNGYSGGVEEPAAFPDVVAVGGTSLSTASNARGWTETAWSGAGSGCSAYSPKPSWQTDTGCARRTSADVSADANPSTGAAVYDTYDGFGWIQVGGTSESSPIIAATYALSGAAGETNPASFLYADPSGLFDVTSGSTGSCTPSYLCTAGPGYDGPTGLGSPDGTAAFGPNSSTPPPSPIVNSTPPAISGTPQDGLVLKASPGTWSVPSGTKLTYTYQWEACANGACSAIGGATKSSYEPRAAVVGRSLEVLVTATDVSGDTATATSAQAGPVADPTPPVEKAPPSIKGTPVDGSTLTAVVGQWTSPDKLSYAYTWQACPAGGSQQCNMISHASSVRLTSADVGDDIVLIVTAIDQEGQAVAAETSPTSPVATPAAPVNTKAPVISGTDATGQTLRVSPGTWKSADKLTYTYAWQSCTSAGACTTVSESPTYKVQASDAGNSIDAQVTATDGEGQSTTATSNSVGSSGAS